MYTDCYPGACISGEAANVTFEELMSERFYVAVDMYDKLNMEIMQRENEGRQKKRQRSSNKSDGGKSGNQGDAGAAPLASMSMPMGPAEYCLHSFSNFAVSMLRSIADKSPQLFVESLSILQAQMTSTRPLQLLVHDNSIIEDNGGDRRSTAAILGLRKVQYLYSYYL